MDTNRLLGLIIASIFVLACSTAHADLLWGESAGEEPTEAATGQSRDPEAPLLAPPAQATPIATASPVPTNESLQFAVMDLAQRLAVDPAAITVIAVEDVTWSDSSLGCPEPGMAYMQVLTPGQRIRLGVDGRVFEYHGGRSGMPRYCERPEEPVSDGSRLDGPILIPEPIVLPAEPPK